MASLPLLVCAALFIRGLRAVDYLLVTQIEDPQWHVKLATNGTLFMINFAVPTNDDFWDPDPPHVRHEAQYTSWNAENFQHVPPVFNLLGLKELRYTVAATTSAPRPTAARSAARSRPRRRHPSHWGASTLARALGRIDSESLFLLCFAEERRLGQSEEQDFFAGYCADVVVQAQHLGAGDLLHHRFHDRPRRFDQMGPDLFEQVPPLVRRQRLDQVLFGCGEHALKANHEEILEQVGLNVLGSPAHVILFEATDPRADGGFDFSLALHDDPTPFARPKSARVKTAVANYDTYSDLLRQSTCFDG
jgi:hypothetical protein